MRDRWTLLSVFLSSLCAPLVLNLIPLDYERRRTERALFCSHSLSCYLRERMKRSNQTLILFDSTHNQVRKKRKFRRLLLFSCIYATCWNLISSDTKLWARCFPRSASYRTFRAQPHSRTLVAYIPFSSCSNPLESRIGVLKLPGHSYLFSSSIYAPMMIVWWAALSFSQFLTSYGHDKRRKQQRCGRKHATTMPQRRLRAGISRWRIFKYSYGNWYLIYDRDMYVSFVFLVLSVLLTYGSTRSGLHNLHLKWQRFQDARSQIPTHMTTITPIFCSCLLHHTETFARAWYRGA